MKRPVHKMFRSVKRNVQRNRLPIVTMLLFAGLFLYATYMTPDKTELDPASSKPLLDLIAKAESNGNYNAYFGNSTNTSVRFTSMSIAEVMNWQRQYIADGSPSSAVGRYQIIDSTLAGLVKEMGIDPKQKFDERTQDRMAITLLERRGAEAYLKNELSETEFAASLAKEWAGLPKMTGENPEESYYASDGLNKSRVKPDLVLGAIKPIQARDD